MKRITRFSYWLVVLLLFLTYVPPLNAQQSRIEVPRTRTFPGIESPAFPYAQPEEVGLSSEKLDHLGEEITAWVANGDLVGAELLIIKDGRAIFHEAYGWSDREEQRPMERGSIFSIKSMSKPFTATAILMLAEEGELSLDDPVSRYIPGFAGDERTRIRHLLSHTSGYEAAYGGGGGYDVYYFDSLREWTEDLAAHEPTGVFGEFSYSNFNYAALGYIVEVVSGVPVETFTEKRIIEPLELEETYTAFSPNAPWAARVPSRYRWNAGAGDYERMWANRDPQPWVFYPAGFGLWTTAMDYAEFMSMWLKKGRHQGVRLLAEETVDKALEPHGVMDGVAASGYGWFSESARDEGAGSDVMSFLHMGGDGTMAIAFPADDAVVIYLTHSQGTRHLDALWDRISMAGIFDYPGPSMMWADEHDRAVVELTPVERARYVGTFRQETAETGDGADLVVHVRQQEGVLHARLGKPGVVAGLQSHLVPLGDDSFAWGRYEGEELQAINPSVTIRFAVEGDRATAVHIGVDGEAERTADRIDEDRLLETVEAERNRVSIATILRETLEAEGIEATRGRHRALHRSRPDSIRFAASLLHALGHRLLNEGRTEEAIAVFEMNAEAYPEVPIAHGGLGSAYRVAGRLEEAKLRFERAVRLSEGQAHPKWRMYWRIYRANLERVTQQLKEK